MLLAFIICHLCVFVAANPFHKYPFVFLLDVGNEELEKTNSEQIRVSIPGGSLALRYPAIGNGNTISHVRVSGIDFGTDLKANIVDGGPGYKYVVLVFMGSPAVPYDAVVTIKTVSDNVLNIQNVEFVGNSANNFYQTEEDANNSSEDLNDYDNSQISIEKSSSELMQSSDNMYNYVENESNNVSDDDSDKDNNFDNDGEVTRNVIYLDHANKEDSDENDDYDKVNNEKDIPYSKNLIQENDADVQVQNIGTVNDNEEDDDDTENNSPSLEQSPDYSKERPIVLDNNLYSKYKALEDHLNFERKVYSQEEVQNSQKPLYREDLLDYKDNDDSGFMYDDEEWSNSVEKYKDSNNKNDIDSDDSYAIAY